MENNYRDPYGINQLLTLFWHIAMITLAIIAMARSEPTSVEFLLAGLVLLNTAQNYWFQGNYWFRESDRRDERDIQKLYYEISDNHGAWLKNHSEWLCVLNDLYHLLKVKVYVDRK